MTGESQPAKKTVKSVVKREFKFHIYLEFCVSAKDNRYHSSQGFSVES